MVYHNMGCLVNCLPGGANVLKKSSWCLVSFLLRQERLRNRLAT